MATITLLVLWLPIPREAVAQRVTSDAGEAANVARVTLRIETPKASLAVLPEYPPEDSDVDPPITVCEIDCSLNLREGNYRLEVSGPDESDIRRGTTAFTVDGDSKVTVEPASKGRFAGGLGVGITGTVIAGAATVITLFGLFINSAAECTSGCQNDTQESRDKNALKILEVGGAVALGGAIMATIGWTVFAHNTRPRVKVEPVEHRSTAIETLRLGPSRMHAGWGLGAEMNF
jgi:hypothetical protein